jgi:hypothetical protein
MGDVVLSGKVLAWGNSFGLRITRDELREAGLQPGDEVSLRILARPARIDLSGLPALEGGEATDSERHDALLAEFRAERLRGKSRGKDR